ncbi:MAG: hypothetical protein JXO49_00100 [Deltaproteobacteria bacterium]|nr:hypothetical protein [Candidatus Anaeroferrophillus wilburensis]MBN2887725.1 hypothetical protein [Deltaproteobacteria bacterium]
MIYFAYDGSLNGDWVARYAIRFAVHSAEKTLLIINVADAEVPADLLSRKVDYVREACARWQVQSSYQQVPLRGDVFHTLQQVVPPDKKNQLVCGLRMRGGRRGFLAGTVSEKLLGDSHFHVLAIRVVQPGLLGNPCSFLLPVAGHPRKFHSAWPFFRLFLPEVSEVCVVRIMTVHRFWMAYLTPVQLRTLRAEGHAYVATIISEILQGCPTAEFKIDGRVILSADWPGEIMVQANKMKAGMILLGASERSRPHRIIHRHPLERILANTPCDVGIYRGL